MYAPGVTLGDRYRLEERIGGGGMGEVWRGTDEVLGRTVAVKVMLPSLVREPGFARRFLSEARAMARISHPGVVDIHDYRGDETGAFLVMEYVPGESLARVLRRDGALGPVRTMEVVAQAAEALRAVHAEGIVHRDLKPGNLLVRPDGAVVLTDFGIARSAGATQLTATGAVIGTAPYLSPEQALGRPASAASDLYALGVVAYQCLRGAPPFDGDSPVEVVMKHVRDEPPALPADVPPAVRALVMKALAKDPEHRWRSADELAAAARRAAGDTTAPPPPEPTRGPTGTRQMTPPPTPPAAPPYQPPLPHRSSPHQPPPAAPAPYPPAAAPRPVPTPPPRAPVAAPPMWAPGRRTPPPTVTIASLLLLTAAACFGVYFLAEMTVYETIHGVYRDVYADAELADLGPALAGLHATLAVILLISAFVLLLLAWRTYRGRRAARGWTITLSLLTLCCCGAGIAFSGAGAENLDGTEFDRAQSEVQEQLAETLPSWYELVSGTTILIGLVALLTATVLLATPPSNRYFRLSGPVLFHPYPYHPYQPR